MASKPYYSKIGSRCDRCGKNTQIVVFESLLEFTVDDMTTNEIYLCQTCLTELLAGFSQ